MSRLDITYSDCMRIKMNTQEEFKRELRDLLTRIIAGDDDGDFFISHELYEDIQKSLAQAEQKLEPLNSKEIANFLDSKADNGFEISYDYEQGFESGIKFAESHYGIGGGRMKKQIKHLLGIYNDPSLTSKEREHYAIKIIAILNGGYKK